MSAEARYYYVDAQNQAAGPIAMAGLLALKASGTISDVTLVVLEGGTEWVAFSTLKPADAPAPQPAAASVGVASGGTGALQIAPRERTANPSRSDSTGWAGGGLRGPSLSEGGSSTAEPPWASQLSQKVDQLTSAMDKLVLALEKARPAAPVMAPATAALHAEKINLNPAPKPGIASVGAQANPRPTPLPAGVPIATPRSIPAPRAPGVSTPLSPLAVPANAQKSTLPLPALGKTPGPTPGPAAAAPAKGNIFSKFLKK